VDFDYGNEEEGRESGREERRDEFHLEITLDGIRTSRP
jgi:hypothetical protein